MITTKLLGAASLAATAERRQGYLKSETYKITLEALTKISKTAKRAVPVDTGLLRSNITIAINTDFAGKNLRLKRGAGSKVRKTTGDRVSTAALQRWLNDVDGEVRGAVFDDLPYAWRRDVEGGITKPPYFLRASGVIGKHFYMLKLKKMTLKVGSI